VRVHLCGTRGSTPAPGPEFVRYGGHTSCVAIAHDDAAISLLLDAGTGIRRASLLLDGRPFDGCVLLGHLHWDHTQGLPFFHGGDQPDARVDVYLPEQGDDPVAVLARGLSPPHFPIEPTGLRGRWRFHNLPEGRHHIEGFDVLAREIPHKGGRTFGYRISDGATCMAYLSDHHPVAFGPGPGGYGPYHQAACELAAGADLLLHDAQYLPSEWAARRTFGHATVDYAVGLAEAAGVGRLVLFHHDPARTDDEIDALTERARRGSAVEIVAARQDDVFYLVPGDG
jgi:phosphoribosyl 1,2-cyclic phosphodiesterase